MSANSTISAEMTPTILTGFGPFVKYFGTASFKIQTRNLFLARHAFNVAGFLRVVRLAIGAEDVVKP